MDGFEHCRSGQRRLMPIRVQDLLEGFLREGSRLAVGAIPIDPASAAARSERMSACRFVATIVSRLEGWRTILTVIASTTNS
jgi:hypothetical protein